MNVEQKETSLEGEHIVLEPLTLEHQAALSIAVADGNLWELWYTSVPHPDDMKAYIEAALEAESRGEALAFAVRDRYSGEIVGSTRICNWQQQHRRLEIGYTWYAKSAQRSAVNTEAKLLLLSYAFETLDVMAVEFRTHVQNQIARQAICRLGANQDGILRNHQILNNDTVRDTVVYSIIDTEWPEVKQGLKDKLVSYEES
ncbi:GNAT family N-acetyltransferase [Shewanella schlegeliana]|uniref:GNAT family N-acetyltransferase n=1 Tax=Shewanella schlegeliana TaxID=190308 RepID=A0ABS1T2T2_9GAMM|nr:GNAT family protein [Shewanella schlegeliana]MBL4915102.1 GNAT family N-acetyltransferase [Shewanella schlegeliana]MCL1111032.1 GNAT family N-acetyltransferase [Shewanella schlegeliana]GIU29121.1 GCN5 family N-acetyltransferase [Shewanella schlegeliana]